MFASRITAIKMLFISSLAMLCGCATATSGVAGSEHKQNMPVSPPELNYMAAESYTRLKSDAVRQSVLNHDLVLLQRANAIVERLWPQTVVFRPEALGWNREVNVIATNQVNVFCLPGGKIMIYSGLYRQLGLSDDELAAAIAHAIAHALRDHYRVPVSQALAAKSAADASEASYQTFIDTRFSRSEEHEADRIGLELMARAGYDPRAGVTFWQKMVNIKDGLHPPEFVISHPTEANRAQTIQSLLPITQPFYEVAPQP